MNQYKTTALVSVLSLLMLGTFIFNGGLTSFSGGLQAAATILGDLQGVPPGYTGHPNPDYANCWVNLVAGTQGWDGSKGSLCVNNTANPFYSGIFSINPADNPTSGESVYANSAWIPEGFVQGPLLGPPFSTLGCPDGATMTVTGTDPDTGEATSGECYSGGTPGGGGGGGVRVGPATYCYSFNQNGVVIQKYSFPSGYSAATGDKLDITGSGPSVDFGDGGGGGGNRGDGNCYAWKWAPAHISSSLLPAGSTPTVAPGGELTLQWSCLPSRVVNGWGCRPSGATWQHPFGVSCSESQYTTNILRLEPLAMGVSGNGPNFVSGASLADTKKIKAPSTKGTYNYSLTCGGPYALPAMIIPVNVGDAPVQPTISITGNGQSGTVRADLGTTTVTIVGTFAPGTGDMLTRTALNGCTTPDKANPDQNCQNPLPGVNNTDAATPKTYAFKPTAPGLYYFYPAVQTQLFFSWNDYGKKLIVNAQCAAGSSWATDSTGKGGHCAPDPKPCPNGQTNPPACTVCGPGTHDNGSGVCVPNTCTDPHAIPPLCSTCISGYEMKNGSCVLIPPTLSLSAAQPVVRKGNPAKLSWRVIGLVPDSGTQCALSSSPAGVFSAVMPNNTAPVWSGSNVSTGSIEGTTFFTLSCTGAQSVSVKVNMIPVVIEI